MKFLLRILVLALAVTVIVFSVINSEEVAVDVWPLLQTTVDLPVWGIAWLGIIAGLIVGYIVGWFGGGNTRRRARAFQRRVENDQREIAMLRKQLAKYETAEREARIPLPPASAA